MAVTETKAAHLLDDARPYPTEEHGKLRIIHGTITQGAAAGDAGSSVVIGNLPPGKVVIFPHLCRYKVSALGASRTMDIGHKAYVKRGDQAATEEADDDNAFADNIDVSGATDAAFPTTAGQAWEMWSRAGIQLYATVDGGTIPAAATFEFTIVFADVN
jgi:hypothetical protein